MLYDRKIKYIDYIQNGERVRGAGFVKLEVRDDICNVQIQVTGLPATDSFSRPVNLIGQEQEAALCQLALKQGRGTVQLQLSSFDLLGGKKDSRVRNGEGDDYRKLAYNAIEALRIPLSAGRELYCAIAENASFRKQPDPVTQGHNPSTTSAMGEPEQQSILQKQGSSEQPNMHGKSSVLEKLDVSEKQGLPEQLNIPEVVWEDSYFSGEASPQASEDRPLEQREIQPSWEEQENDDGG